MSRVVSRIVLALACLVALPGAALAQSAITGVVRDTSGGVLPGVTVEASSPALIEGTRTVYTDGEGLYRIENLRPGDYVVVFTLPGFQTLRRDGTQKNVVATMQTRNDLYDFLGYHDYEQKLDRLFERTKP